MKFKVFRKSALLADISDQVLYCLLMFYNLRENGEKCIEQRQW